MTGAAPEGFPSTPPPFASMIGDVTDCASGGRGLDASARGQWQSKLGFVMATAGAAVGLGNIWRFPILATENGGGAFVTVYLILVAVVGIPALFAFGLPVQGGPGLTFVTFPAVFNALPAGSVFGVAFFVMLAIAALTSSISMLEVVVAAWIEERGGARRTAAVLAGSTAFLLGVPSALSQGAWDGARGGLPFLGAMDFLASNLLLPLGGLLTAVYIGWVWGGTWRRGRDPGGSLPFPPGTLLAGRHPLRRPGGHRRGHVDRTPALAGVKRNS